MSKRRNPGDIVVKKAMSGFITEACIIQIPTLKHFTQHKFPYTSEKEDHDSCMLNCGDPSCVEYANVLVVKNGVTTNEWVYHVSECQMEDLAQ